MSMHDLHRALKVDENSSIGASSLAAATSSDASAISCFSTYCSRWAWSWLGDRRNL